jgi:hypothetical protein
VAGKGYCCEVGQSVSSDSCPSNGTLAGVKSSVEKPDNSALIIGISVSASVIVVLIMGLLLWHKLKKPNPVVIVPVLTAVPVPSWVDEASRSHIIRPSKNASMDQYAGASAPPPPVNPQFVVQENVIDCRSLGTGISVNLDCGSTSGPTCSSPTPPSNVCCSAGE